MPRRSRPTLIVASLLAAACLGAGGGAVAYATLHDNGTNTVVRQVTVQQADQGSGWVYDTGGHIVTNDHVVDGSTSINVRFWDGKTYSANIVGVDKSTDLA